MKLDVLKSVDHQYSAVLASAALKSVVLKSAVVESARLKSTVQFLETTW